MFYSSQLLSRKTPLGICWLASHLESKRLKRAQVFEVSISQSCDSIINPEAPLALRLSGQLLLGVVRIYQRKLTFLETDAKNAIDGLQRKEGASQNVDLPDGGTAPEMTITLPETEIFGGNELFPSFAIADTTPGGGALLGGAGGNYSRLSLGAESLTMADDISDVFGSTRWTGSEERFDLVGGEDIDRRFSAELERLRSQAAVEAPRDAMGGDMFYDAAGDDSFGGAPFDEIMEPPGQDLFLATGGLGAGPTPGSTGGGGGVPLPGKADIRITPPSLGFSDMLPDIGTGGTSPGGAMAPASAQERQQQRKKKRVHVDIGADGRPATQLPGEEIRKLLNNRAPLLKERGLNADDIRAIEVPRGAFDVRAQSTAARESAMYRPACFERLAPEIMQVFNRAFGADSEGRAPAAQRAAGNKSRAALAGAEGAGADPFAASPGEGDQLGVPEPYGDTQSPALSWGDGGAFDDGGGGFEDDDDDGVEFQRDPIEASQDMGGTAPGSIGRGAAPALDMETAPRSASHGDGVSEDVGGGGGSEVHGYARDGFTSRTKVVLEHLQGRFAPAPAPGSKRRHPSSSSPLSQGVESLTLDGIVAGKSRLEACRWFFEALVLRNKGFVDLEQAEAYGEVTIRPLQRLLEQELGGASVPGTSVRPTPVSEFAPSHA